MKKGTIIKYMGMAAIAATLAGVMTACGEQPTPQGGGTGSYSSALGGSSPVGNTGGNTTDGSSSSSSSYTGVKTELTAPENLYLSFDLIYEKGEDKTRYVLTWDSVENASGYEITVDGETVSEAETANCDLTEYLPINEKATIGVTALGEWAYSNSDESYFECAAEPVSAGLAVQSTVDGGCLIYCKEDTVPARVVLPDTYYGLPVTGIEEYGFAGFMKKATKRTTLLQSVRLPRGLTTLGMGAFYYSTLLKEIDLPEGLKSIGESAFSGCALLKEIDLPEGLESIGGYAFDSSGLESIVLPSALKEWEEAFTCCGELTRVTLSDGLTEIPSCAFAYCAKLTEIQIPETVTVIDSLAFAGCESLKNIKFPSGLTVFKGFMYHESLTEITLPSSVTEICFEGCTNLQRVSFEAGSQMETLGERAFYLCGALKEIELPLSLKKIERFAFEGCTSFSAVEIPKGVTSIIGGAFGGCTSLKEIALETGNGAYKTVNGDLYTIDGKTLVQYACGKEETEFTVPVGVETVGERAFYGSLLKKVVVPSWVKRIEDSAFYDSRLLEELSLSEGLEYIGKSFVGGRSALKRLKIPASVKIIGEYTFSEQNISYLELSEGVEAIENYAVGGLAIVENLIVPTSMKKFGEQIVAIGFFSGCVNNVYYLGTAEEWAKIENSDKFKPRKGLYFYSEEEPTEEGNFWRYVDGVPTPWGEE
ncbi:MAG: leucine-rich repeat domain-containing protein [Clostridia bacterium]|nr:leucine-rich repeat domain-containing protein [Clostridia bacterium]